MGVFGVLRALFAATTVTALSVLATYLYQYKKKLKLLEPWQPVGKVTKLCIYPLKSGRKIEVDEAECTEYGLRLLPADGSYQFRDRQFVVYSAYDNEQRTAKTYPKMILIEVVSVDENRVAFKAPGMITLHVKVPTPGVNKETYIIGYRDEKIYSIDCGDEAAAWISRYVLEKDSGLRLGYHDGKHRRDISKTHEPFLRVYKSLSNRCIGMYSDLASYLLINKESIDDLVNRIPENGISVDNFRPTILVEGAPAYDEDDWELIKIGDVTFEAVKPCTRCSLTTIHPQMGVKNQNREPLTTLEKYRQVTHPDRKALEKNSPVMGVYMGLTSQGKIKVGDTVYVKK